MILKRRTKAQEAKSIVCPQINDTIDETTNLSNIFQEATQVFAIGVEYEDHHPGIRVTVLRNEFNRGYGDNQKIGYAYAIAERFDFVAMVHGDGQYAPEELPRLMEPLREGNADAVLGSRMIRLSTTPAIFSLLPSSQAK